VREQKLAKSDESLPELKKLVDATLYSLIPFMLLSVIAGILSNSMTILAVAFDYGLSFVVQLFAFKAIRTIVKSNIIKFPYGAGKLENFSAIVYGALAIPVSLFIIYSSITRFVLPPVISIGIAQIPLIPNLVRSLLLFWRSRQLARSSESPMIHSYYINFKVTAMTDASILATLSAVLLFTTFGHSQTAYIIDPIVSSLLGAYMLFSGIKLSISNFKVLIDLPLPEEDQLKIMTILAQEYNYYENIGNIYTRFSGKTRFIEIELYLKKELTLEEITILKQRIEKNLQQHFLDLRFVLIPISEENSRNQTPPN
jgi:ferrous-iron efflux pump FieF